MGVEDRDTAPTWMLNKSFTWAPSLYARCCWCMCAPEERKNSGLDQISQLRGLAGVTVQKGSHSTAGSLETLKWARWDAQTRVLEEVVFGGFYSRSSLGLWTEPTTPLWKSALWCCLMNLGRNSMYQYRSEFSEDYRRADIKVQGNIAFVCCCCCPFCPAWFTIPTCLNEQYMVQAPDSTDGTHWVRYCGVCSQPATKYYDLKTAWNVDGTPGPGYDDVFLFAPKQVQITF